MPTVRRLHESETHRLSEILCDAVERGASVSFLLPFSKADAAHFWNSIFDKQSRGELLLLGAFDDHGELQGTAQLHLRMPPNQPHRAEVAKVLVHSRARRQGLGLLLMQEVEAAARAAGKTLLILDTQTGSAAEAMYEKLGYQQAGVIPDYALLPDGRPAATTIFYKQLSP